MYKVLLIDDEESVHVIVRTLLEDNGYAYVGARDAASGLAAIEREHPDLLLLDVMLPGKNGFDICSEIRARGRRIPVIFVSAKTDIVDKTVGFRAGGDDYVTKPFDTAELLLRIEAHIRRHKDAVDFAHCTSRDGIAAVGDLEVHFDEYRAYLAGKEISLTTKEFEILSLLIANPGKVFTRGQIQEYIWGKREVDEKSNSITVFIRKIREKIEENPSEPKYLLTVQRVGYKMTDSL